MGAGFQVMKVNVHRPQNAICLQQMKRRSFHFAVVEKISVTRHFRASTQAGELGMADYERQH